MFYIIRCDILLNRENFLVPRHRQDTPSFRPIIRTSVSYQLITRRSHRLPSMIDIHVNFGLIIVAGIIVLGLFMAIWGYTMRR